MTSESRACLTNPRLLLTVGLIFFAGAVAGALIMRFGLHGMLHPQQPYWQEGGKQVSVQLLTGELELTPAQQAELETELDDFVMYMQMLQAQVEELRASGKQRIMRVLDDRQKKKFEELLVEVQQARR